MNPHDDYEEYVKKYAERYHITIEEAEQHSVVKSYKEYCASKSQDLNGPYSWKE